MAATNQEIQGNFVLHQELCGQLDQEMHQHHNLEGLPWDGGGIRQELLQRKLMKERMEFINYNREKLANGSLQCQEDKETEGVDEEDDKKENKLHNTTTFMLHCIYLYCDHVYASRTSFVFWSALTLIYFRIIHVE